MAGFSPVDRDLKVATFKAVADLNIRFCFSPVDRDLKVATPASQAIANSAVLFQSRRPGFEGCD